MSAYRIVLLCIFGLFLVGCQQDRQKSGPWLPVLEPTSFSYLEDTVARGLAWIDRAEAELAVKNQEKALENLQQSRHALLELRHYFVPMTQVRQLVYDADRLYFLNRVKEARNNLTRARGFLIAIGNSDGETLRKAASEAETMIDRLLPAMEQSPSNVAEQFRSLGHKVNMLAIKGDLVLSGVRFSEEQGTE